MKYTIRVREILSRDVEIEAENPEKARQLVKDKYAFEEIVLDYSDWKDTSFDIAEE